MDSAIYLMLIMNTFPVTLHLYFSPLSKLGQFQGPGKMFNMLAQDPTEQHIINATFCLVMVNWFTSGSFIHMWIYLLSFTFSA